jgi:DNA polymerase-3 subunit gamma/tau
MRDALSLLDQVLSFGEGPVTAARVRDVLGLISDENYGEMLRCIVERDAAGVFRLVERLLEAGADLGEFVSGAGETLRALLLLGVGGEPEGLTEGLLTLVRQYAPRLPPADVVRLLTMLGESEEGVRRSGNTRLAVEVLLLRWAMADRTIELSRVLEALGKGTGDGGRGTSAPVAPAPSQLRDSTPVQASPVPPPTPTPTPTPSPLPSDKGPLTLEHLRSVWGSIVADARARAPMIGSLLAEAEVSGVEGRVVMLRPASAGHSEGLERQREVIAQVIGRYVTETPRVKLAPGAAEPRDAQPERPVRLTEERANADRLRTLRAKDPTLSAAVDALDLELLE